MQGIYIDNSLNLVISYVFKGPHYIGSSIQHNNSNINTN